MLPAWAAPNSNLMYLTYQTGMQMQLDMVIFHQILNHYEFASMRVKYLMCASFGGISSSLGPLCNGPISAWLSTLGQGITVLFHLA